MRAGEPGEARTTRGPHDGRPSVSVVSVATDDSAVSLRHLADRFARWDRLGVELILVCASRRTTRSTVSAISGGARLIYGPADASEPQLRAIGLAAATGDVVMLVDDPAAADDAWIENVSITGSASAETAVSPAALETPEL